MSHGGFGGGGGGGHHGGMGHHGGTGHHTGMGHHSGVGGVIIDASLCLDLLQGVFVTLFPFLKRWIKPKEVLDNGPDSFRLSREEEAEWERSFRPPTLKERLMHMDLRPFILLVLFFGGIVAWSSLVYWLRHTDDPTGKSWNKFKTKDLVVGATTNGNNASPAQQAGNGQGSALSDQSGYTAGSPTNPYAPSAPVGTYPQPVQQSAAGQSPQAGSLRMFGLRGGYASPRAQYQHSGLQTNYPQAANSGAAQSVPYSGYAPAQPQVGFQVVDPQTGMSAPASYQYPAPAGGSAYPNAGQNSMPGAYGAYNSAPAVGSNPYQPSMPAAANYAQQAAAPALQGAPPQTPYPGNMYGGGYNAISANAGQNAPTRHRVVVNR